MGRIDGAGRCRDDLSFSLALRAFTFLLFFLFCFISDLEWRWTENIPKSFLYKYSSFHEGAKSHSFYCLLLLPLQL